VDLGRVAGFSGTREGLTSFQRGNLLGLLVELRPRVLHHGDCVGADTEAHLFCIALRTRVRIHPPEDDRLRAWCSFVGSGLLVEMIYDAKPYLVRNRDIVDESDYLIGCPKGPEAVVGSGSWATIRYAREVGRPVFVLWPDGKVDSPSGLSVGF
jgi:predicted Rossmann fold nucleotide-binding protein DprA/Smf involved in DNA uptake